ncbi:MAG TPA: hypothetical protein VH560_00775, partial [Polyangia bacterium]|nr:hypothetical protein [Polyangia bacterium]
MVARVISLSAVAAGVMLCACGRSALYGGEVSAAAAPRLEAAVERTPNDGVADGAPDAAFHEAARLEGIDIADGHVDAADGVDMA